MSEPLVTALTLLDATEQGRTFIPWGEENTPPPETPADRLAAAYANGYDAGRLDSKEALEKERAALALLARSLAGAAPESPSDLAALIVTTVERLVTDLVGKAPVDRDDLAARALAAAALITASDQASTMHLHPDDIALLGDLDVGLALAADPALPRGALRIGCAAGSIEDDRAARLAALRDVLGLSEIAS
jgi:flagellar assembly protein FliH